MNIIKIDTIFTLHVIYIIIMGNRKLATYGQLMICVPASSCNGQDNTQD